LPTGFFLVLFAAMIFPPRYDFLFKQ